VVAVVVAAGVAIVQFRGGAVSIEAADGDGHAPVSTGWPPLPGRGDETLVRVPSSDSSVAPFQIRPAAVVQHAPAGDRSLSGSRPGASAGTVPVADPQVSEAAAPPVPESSAALTVPDDRSGKATAVASGDSPAGVAAPAPTAPAPAPVVITPPSPPTATVDPVRPTPATTSAPPPTSSTASPEAGPTRGKSAAHLPDQANGGVGNTDRPTPPDPRSTPSN